MNTLRDRQKEFRKSGTWKETNIELDETDIFIIDYDLLESSLGGFLTSEHVSYLTRCFSKCSLIIGLNLPPYRDNGFDLTLKGNPSSYADLNIGGKQIANPGLWGNNFSGFRPWHWPILPQYFDNYHKKLSDVKESIETKLPIWEVIGFKENVFKLLPRSIAQFLGRDIELPTITFKDFVLMSGNGLRSKDSHDSMTDEVIARIGVARISKWLERMVLPGQDILVDCPHLIARFPSLLSGNKKDINSWNKTTQISNPSNLGINIDQIESFRLSKPHWISRPVWFWDQIRECQDILEVKSPWKSLKPSWVFCEDASRFYKADYQEFIADLESPYTRRYIRSFKGVEYRPQLRLSI
jgi:hypothetical protein